MGLQFPSAAPLLSFTLSIAQNSAHSNTITLAFTTHTYSCSQHIHIRVHNTHAHMRAPNLISLSFRLMHCHPFPSQRRVSCAGQTYEGGIRVPGIARWPGVLPAGKVLHEPVTALDLLPTFLSLANASTPQDRIIDGADVSDMLAHPHNASRSDKLIWHYCGRNVTAARNGRYKIHFATQIWATDQRPSPLCTECCPYSPFAFNGTGGSLCPCDEANLEKHDPPLVFDMLEGESTVVLQAVQICAHMSTSASHKTLPWAAAPYR